MRNQAGESRYDYDLSSLPSVVSYANGTQTRYGYDPAMRTERIHHLHNNATVSLFEYEYDDNGNRTVQRETNGGDQEITTYDYDGNDRLTFVAYPDRSVTYTYDANYNRIGEIHKGSANTTLVDKTYNYNTRNQLTDLVDSIDTSGPVTYKFDQNGNQIEKTHGDTTTEFIFDNRDDLRQVTIGGSTVGQFLYDYQGLRIEKLGERGAERSTFDGQALLQQYDQTNQTRAKFDCGPDRLLSLATPEQDTQFYLQDALGSVSNLISPQGQIQARYQYDAWGIKRAEQADSYNRFAFTGYEEDKETGLLYAKARFYDPDTGKFLSEDAWGGDNMIAPSLHKYLYAYQNPTVWRDPTGNYNEAGHFYTTYYVAREVGYDHETAHELAFYSQLPDEVGEFDAISNKAAHLNTRSSLSYNHRVNPKLIQRVREHNNQVASRLRLRQGGMHGLTGGLAEIESAKARNLVLHKNVGVAGLAIHRLADSYAHRVMNGEELTPEAVLYSEGWGHLSHLKGPDQIHKRKELYLRYVSDLAAALATRRTSDQNEIMASVKKATARALNYITLVHEAEKSPAQRLVDRSTRPHSLVTPDAVIDRIVVQQFERYTESQYIELGDGNNIVKPRMNQIPHHRMNPKEIDISNFKRTIDNLTIYEQFSSENSNETILKNVELYDSELEHE